MAAAYHKNGSPTTDNLAVLAAEGHGRDGKVCPLTADVDRSAADAHFRVAELARRVGDNHAALEAKGRARANPSAAKRSR
jgi:hypothetical protein